MSTLLNFNQLTTGYLQNRKTQEVSTQLSALLRRGELTCLLGANGCGKSTLLKSLCGFLPPLSGHIQINGRPLEMLNRKERARQIAVVLTDRVDNPLLTVAEMVALGRSPHTNFLGKMKPADHEKTWTAMEMAGIATKRESPLNQLSDGERQKALIAKALAQDTPLIVLDEPTAFLDLPARVSVMHLLRKLCKQHEKSILLTTHDLDLALQMADRLWLLGKGPGIMTGAPEDLLLQGKLQSLFENHGIEMDPKTGLFQVRHSCFQKLRVEGHGYPYVLLRRALARHGIAPAPANHPHPLHVKITGHEVPLFHLHYDETSLVQSPSIEPLLQKIILLMKQDPSLFQDHKHFYNNPNSVQ